MSITLTTGSLIQKNGVTVENSTQGALTLLDYDFLPNIARLRFNIGSGAPAAFNIAQFDTPILMQINMTTGVWQATDSQGNVVQSGTFTGAAFSNFQAQFKAIRNAAETFAANNFMPGVQVPWT